MNLFKKLDDRAKTIVECGFILAVVALVVAVLVWVGSNIRRQEAERNREMAKTARERAAFEDAMRMDEKRLIEEKNEAWVRCKAEGNRPVMGGLYAVVCLKHESVAWEQAVQ